MAAGRASSSPYRLVAAASELRDSACCKKPTQKISADDLAVSSWMSPLLCSANTQGAAEKPEAQFLKLACPAQLWEVKQVG